MQKENTPNACLLAKASKYDRIDKGVLLLQRKRSKAQGVGGKPTNVPTFAKRKKAMMGGFMGRRMGVR